MDFFQGFGGDHCIMLREQGSTDRPWGHHLFALPNNKRSQNSTNLKIHEDYVAMETVSYIYNMELYMSFGLLEYAILLKHYANMLCFLFKL